MKLRKLKIEDAPLMIEWMHDDNVVHFMSANFKDKTIIDCEAFINESLDDDRNLHMAIVDDNDVYMGTVSLKNIDNLRNQAEFAITVRKKAMGCGFAKFGMKEIINIGLKELGLNKVYWYVNTDNHRAIKFYNKMNAIKCSKKDLNLDATNIEDKKFTWYYIDKLYK